MLGWDGFLVIIILPQPLLADFLVLIKFGL